MEERRTSYFCGNETVIDDNPKLDVIDWQPCPNRFRSNSRLQKKSHVLDNQIKTIVFTKRQLIPTKKTLPLLSSILKNIATQLTDALYDHQIQSVIIEGGRQTLQTFIDANLWDEARVFRGTIHLKEGTAAPY
jgi:diaminohydroxyphosphoribosylaminopyrimidine deaminase/5-amino-6-(5-phosphoribosylamino)uracil reductase